MTPADSSSATMPRPADGRRRHNAHGDSPVLGDGRIVSAAISTADGNALLLLQTRANVAGVTPMELPIDALVHQSRSRHSGRPIDHTRPPSASTRWG